MDENWDESPREEQGELDYHCWRQKNPWQIWNWKESSSFLKETKDVVLPIEITVASGTQNIHIKNKTIAAAMAFLEELVGYNVVTT